MKFMVPTVFRAASVAAFVFLNDFQQEPQHTQQPLDGRDRRTPNEISDSRLAFEECFRCLLAGAMQMMPPHAVTGALLGAARTLNIALWTLCTKCSAY